jgi:hypothetical protein
MSPFRDGPGDIAIQTGQAGAGSQQELVTRCAEINLASTATSSLAPCNINTHTIRS